MTIAFAFLPQAQAPMHALVPTVLTSVKVFDASDITDTVVISNSFRNTLSSKLPALLVAQVLASVAFVSIVSALVAQGKFLLEVAATNETTKKTTKLNREPLSIDFSKLLLCIIIDTIGSANEAIPIVGEIVDVVYAPIAALLLRQLFQGSNVVFLLEFVEEILPFTDVLPLATICWVVDTFYSGGTLARALRIGDFAPVIDVGIGEILKEGPGKDKMNFLLDDKNEQGDASD
jgi:hypothetical protein